MNLDLMEPATKSPKLNSSCEINVVQDEEDRFNFLPTHVAHHILSFLSIEDIARLSWTSKLCEKLCLSAPSLTISDDQLSKSCPVQRTQFIKFLLKFMEGRQAARIRKLAIRWYFRRLNKSKTNRVMWFLNHAMECRVRDLNLNLQLQTGAAFVMPLDLFCCESLRSLTIYMHAGALELPTPRGFSHLRSLDLDFIEINDDSFGEKISSACKFLEKLKLECISSMKKFKISSSSLLELRILEGSCIKNLDISARSLQTLDLNWALLSSDVTYMNVYAPNLLYLYLDGVFGHYCFVENLSLLQTIHLILSPNHRVKIKLNSLLQSIVQVSCLHINVHTIQVLDKDGCLPLIVNNLQTLELTLDLQYPGWTDSRVQSVARFLQGLTPNLKKLLITWMDLSTYDSHAEKRSYKHEAKFWESQNLRLVEGLEEIEMSLVGSEFEERLLEYLLENAKQLKKVTISFGRVMRSAIVCKLLSAAVTRGLSFCHEEQKKVVLKLKQT